MKRRSFLASATSASAVAFTPPNAANAGVSTSAIMLTVPITGQPVPELVAFDRGIVGFLERYKIPGGL